MRPVRFEFEDPFASSIFVAGTFNEWNPHASPLRSVGKGRWVLELFLSPGTYEYRFLVDGTMKPDPRAQHHVTNFCGALNSVLLVK